jgi:hypothetical protein
LLPAPSARHISEPMAGSPLKRRRKLGVRLGDGRVIAFPRMPRVTDLPPGWRHFSAAQKIEHLIGFDQAREILSWPMAELDPLRLSLKMQVIGAVLRFGIKAALAEAALERDRERVFAEMARDLERLRQAGGTTPDP